MVKISINVHCPFCKKVGSIDISENAFENMNRGIIAVNVLKTICPHSFIVYIDEDLQIRDSFATDFQIKIPDIVHGEETIPIKELVNLDLIKINLPTMLITYIIKSIFFKKKIILISDDSYLNNYIINFFNYITKNSFDFDISFISKEEYNKYNKKYQDCMVFEGKEILRNADKIINPKKLKIEKAIINKFLLAPESMQAMFLLKNEIQTTYVLSKSIVDYLKNYEKKVKELENEVYKVFELSKSIEDFINIYEEKDSSSSGKIIDDLILTNFIDNVLDVKKMNSKVIINYLTKIHNIKIPKIYLNFLMEIINSYFEINVLKYF